MRAMTTSQLLSWNPPFQPYIISDGILLPQTKMILFGKFETWKSMLAIHTAFTLANGQPWFNFKTAKCSSYTLQLEIPKQEHRKRVAKYIKGNEVSLDETPVYFLTETYFKLDRPAYQQLMEQELAESKVSVLIVDPIYQVVSGRLTDEYDARKFTDRMDTIIDKYKIAVIMVHHERKSQIFEGEAYSSSEDIFGSSIFIDWCDTAIRTTKLADSKIELSFDKVRHAERLLKPIVVDINREDLTFHLTKL